MKDLFDKVSVACSRITTRAYSTSFSLGILCLNKKLRDPIYSIYGFVRLADEIVDSFHTYNKADLLERFKSETWKAIEEGISLNPILNSFQKTVHQYKIDRSSIELFMRSMEMDLYRSRHDHNSFNEYILGSAEVVGLMCLRVFVNGNDQKYNELKPFAMKLGAAFQKVNFLRDLQADYQHMGRSYFPDVDLSSINENSKREIEKSIHADFESAYQGIKMLPRSSRFGVYVAYMYYKALLRKIQSTPCEIIMSTRIRIRNRHKAALLALSYVKHQFNLL